jgi:hypothetical protein
MHLPFQALMNMDKAISGTPRWSKPEGADKSIRLSASLEIEENTLQGFFLKGRARADSPTKDVSFTLTYLAPGTKRDGVTLDRIDWLPKTPHENLDERSPDHLFLMEIDGTHRHSFDLNWRPKNGVPLKWMPIAKPIIPDYQSFAGLVVGVGNVKRRSKGTPDRRRRGTPFEDMMLVC